MINWDARRDLQILEDQDAAVAFAAEHWIHSAQRAIQQHGRFAVALSGGSTPKAIYKTLASKYQSAIDWSKVELYWSDERAVAPDHPHSNYKMAMDNGFRQLPVSKIFPMKGTGDLIKNALEYEQLIQERLGSSLFDLVMLGVGEDGHTASLFPHTEGPKETKKLVMANYVPSHESWRLTFTLPCINQSQKAVIYALGPTKQSITLLVLDAAIHSPFAASAVGTPEHKALWIMDQSAARLISTK